MAERETMTSIERRLKWIAYARKLARKNHVPYRVFELKDRPGSYMVTRHPADSKWVEIWSSETDTGDQGSSDAQV